MSASDSRPDFRRSPRRDPDARCSLRDSVRSVYARARRSVARCIIGVNVCIHTGTASSERSSSSAGTAEASCKGPMRSASRVSASPDRLQTASRRRYANTASWSGVWHLRACPAAQVPRAGPSRLGVRRPASTLTRSDVRRELSRVYSHRRDAQRFGRRSSDMIASGARPGSFACWLRCEARRIVGARPAIAHIVRAPVSALAPLPCLGSLRFRPCSPWLGSER